MAAPKKYRTNKLKSFYLDGDLNDQLEKVAEKTGQTQADIINKSISAYLKRFSIK